MPNRFNAVVFLALVSGCPGPSPDNNPTDKVPATVTVTPASASLKIGATVRLTAALFNASGAAIADAAVAWATDSASVATVDAQSGLVTAVAVGAAHVTATSGSKSAEALVTVLTNVAKVAIGPHPISAVNKGATLQLTASATDANGAALAGKIMLWTTADNTIATVSATGLLTGIASGATTVTATIEGIADTQPVTVISAIGSQGGSLSVADGSGVLIPAGALSSDTVITIQKSPATIAPPGQSVGTSYRFGPEGTQFAVPVTVTLAVLPSQIPTGKSTADVVIQTAAAGSTIFTALPTTVVDAIHVQAKTSHFSDLAPTIPTPPPPTSCSSDRDCASGKCDPASGTCI